MPLKELEERAVAADLEAEALREDLERLQTAIDHLTETLGAAGHDRDVAQAKVRKAHLQLDEARAMADELGAELALAHLEALDLRRELANARLTAEIRGRLLDDVVAAPAWRRGPALRRADRVQRLLARS